jgi:hypothetical protein
VEEWEQPVQTWGEMKVLTRRRFVPNHYYKDLYLKLQGLNQSYKIVDEYHKEMEITMILRVVMYKARCVD